MYVKVKLREGMRYMPLWRRDGGGGPGGEWVPVGKELAETPEEAVKLCLRHVTNKLNAISHHMIEGHHNVGQNIERLDDMPDERDQVLVGGMVRRVNPKDRVLEMPELTPGDDFFDYLKQFSARITNMDDHVMDDLAESLDRDPKKLQAYMLQIIDYARYNPMELLNRVAENHPTKLGALTHILVGIYRDATGKPPLESDHNLIDPDAPDDFGDGGDG